MPKVLLLSVFLFFAASVVKGQGNPRLKEDSLKAAPKDTANGYVNLGRIAGRKAALRSAMIPGWGQAGNGLTVYRGLKIAAIYTGGTLLTLSFIDNNRQYHKYLREIQYRQANSNNPMPGNGLELYENTDGLITAKNIFRRNKEVIIFSFVALYGINIVEAYVDARLKYFDIGNDLALKISPAALNSGTAYGYNPFTPGLKLSLRL